MIHNVEPSEILHKTKNTLGTNILFVLLFIGTIVFLILEQVEGVFSEEVSKYIGMDLSLPLIPTFLFILFLLALATKGAWDSMILRNYIKWSMTDKSIGYFDYLANNTGLEISKVMEKDKR